METVLFSTASGVLSALVYVEWIRPSSGLLCCDKNRSKSGRREPSEHTWGGGLANTVVAHPLAGLSAARHWLTAQSDQTAFSSKFNSDLFPISVWTLKSLFKWDINCLPPYMGLFSPSSCWSCPSQILQGMYLILMFQPGLFPGANA